MVLLNFELALAYLSALLRWPFNPAPSDTAPLCISSSQTLTALTSCHVSLVIQRDLNPSTYAAIQPTPAERRAWLMTVNALLNVDGDCSDVSRSLPEPLRGVYSVLEVGGNCALVETKTIEVGRGKEEYEKGWGMFVVPARKDQVKRDIHLSAPHPIYDAHTGEQASYIFENTGAKSLYIAGRARAAFHEATNCIPSTPSTTYWRTDPAHDHNEMMLETYKAILSWKHVQRGACNANPPAYIQFHGKGKKTCETEQIFLSSGLGRDAASLEWYTDPSHANFPVNRLVRQLNAHFPSWINTTPASPHSTCSLTATKNVVGRLINGVPGNAICSQPAAVADTRGEFVHIEQSPDSRKVESLETWVKVIKDSFPEQKSGTIHSRQCRH